MDAVDDLHTVIHRAQSHPSRGKLPPNSLSIDPFPDRQSINHRLLCMEQNGRGEILRLEDKDPDIITRRINERSALTGAAMRNIGLIVVGFFLHDLETTQERIDFLRSLHEQSPNAVLIVADYILSGASQEEILQLCSSKFEISRKQEMGAQEFIDTHARLSYEKLSYTVGEAYENTNTKVAPAGRAIAAGVPCEVAESSGILPSYLLGIQSEISTVLPLEYQAGFHTTKSASGIL